MSRSILRPALFAVSFIPLFALPAAAATLTPVDASGAAVPFTFELKRDRTAKDDGQRGSDAFLRQAGEFAGPDFDLDWGTGGSEYRFGLAYDGEISALEFTGRSLTLDVEPDGVWNGLRFFLRADDLTRFLSSAVRRGIDDGDPWSNGWG